MISRSLTFIFLASIFTFSCSSTTDDPQENNQNKDGKGDTPNNDPNFSIEETCVDRQAEILKGNRDLFLRDNLRWSCADVAGVNTNNEDSRGQEYCEYFAALRLPPTEDGGEFGESVTVGRNLAKGTTPLGLELSEDQLYYLEDNDSEVLGSCVFTTWHNDADLEIPACETECPDVQGLTVDADQFQMKLFFNGNGAANALVRDCVDAALKDNYKKGELENESDPYHSDYYRACVLTDAAQGFTWRKSDTTVCAVGMRLSECGCVDNGADVANALVPQATEENGFRGFPLGGWKSPTELPSGCRYVELGDNSQTIVTCDLSGSDILSNSKDLKGLCRSRYGDNVVVHVPIPAETITCSPGDNQYASTCTETPWIVTQ